MAGGLSGVMSVPDTIMNVTLRLSLPDMDVSGWVGMLRRRRLSVAAAMLSVAMLVVQGSGAERRDEHRQPDCKHRPLPSEVPLPVPVRLCVLMFVNLKAFVTAHRL